MENNTQDCYDINDESTCLAEANAGQHDTRSHVTAYQWLKEIHGLIHQKRGLNFNLFNLQFELLVPNRIWCKTNMG